MADERCPVCLSLLGIWTDDPIKTQNGLPGYVDPSEQHLYSGFKFICRVHLEELQEARKQQEIDIGIPENERTVFSSIPTGDPSYFHCTKQQIQELRDSTELILDELGISKEEYFNYDEEGQQIFFPGDFGYKIEWTAPNLDNWIGNLTNLHIEDLRHPIMFGWRETFNQTIGYPLEMRDYWFFNLTSWPTFDHRWQEDGYAERWSPSMAGGNCYWKWEIKGDDENKYIQINESMNLLADTTNAYVNYYATPYYDINIPFYEGMKFKTIGSFSNNGDYRISFRIAIKHKITGQVRYIHYLTSNYWTPSGYILVSDVTNLNREIYPDFENKYGVFDCSEWQLYTINNYVVIDYDDSRGGTLTPSLEVTLDLIKLR